MTSDVLRRMHQERFALENKMVKLSRFFDTKEFFALGLEQAAKLTTQAYYMRGYFDILDERINDLEALEAE